MSGCVEGISLDHVDDEQAAGAGVGRAQRRL
jgi:hypothetical protein